MLIFDDNFYQILGYKLLCSPLSLVSKVLKTNLKESQISFINNTFLFTQNQNNQDFSFNYFGFLKIVAKMLNNFFEDKSKMSSDDQKHLIHLLESYYKLYYHLYLFSDKIDIKNISNLHEAFLDQFSQKKNKSFFKFSIRLTLQILMKIIYESNQLNIEISKNFMNIILCLNQLFQKQANCHECLTKKIRLSIYFLEVVEYVLIEIEKKYSEYYNEICLVMRKFYLRNFSTIIEFPKNNENERDIVHNKLLLAILEKLFEISMSDLTKLQNFTKSNKPKSIFKYLACNINLASKIILLNMDMTFNLKEENFSKNYLNQAFSNYKKIMMLFQIIKPCFELIFIETNEKFLNYEQFFVKFLDSSTEYYQLFCNTITMTSCNSIRMIIKTMTTFSDICNYFNISSLSLNCLQISLLIVSTGRALTFENENSNKAAEKNILNILFQSRTCYILQKMYEDYKKLHCKDSMQKINENLLKNFISSYDDSKKFMKIIKDQKDLSIYVEELKQNNIFVYTRYHLHNIEFSKINLNDNIQKLLLLLNKITKKYEKQKNTVFLILKFEILLVLCKNLIYYEFHAMAYSLLIDYNFVSLVSVICHFEEKQMINNENLQNCSYGKFTNKVIKEYLGYNKSRIGEMQQIALKKESKAFFIQRVIEKGVIFNDFWKISCILSKSFVLTLKILNKYVGVYSFSQYYEKLFVLFEMKNLRIKEFFKLINNSSHLLKESKEKQYVLDFQLLFDELLIFSKNNMKESNDLYKIFFIKRRSLSGKTTSLSEIKEKCEKLFQLNDNNFIENKLFMKEILFFILNQFHNNFIGFNQTKEIELFLIKNKISKDFTDKILSKNKDFPFFTKKSHCNLFDEFLLKNNENLIISSKVLKTKHHIFKLDKRIIENDLFMYFLNYFMKIKKSETPLNLINFINLRNILYITANETIDYNMSLSWNYLYMFYQYEENIFRYFSQLIQKNKSEFKQNIDKIIQAKSFKCNCTDSLLQKPKISLIFSMKKEIFLIMKFLNKAYDFKLLKKKYEIISKNNNAPSDHLEIKNLRQSFKNLHFFNPKDSQFVKSIKQGLSLNMPKSMESSFVHDRVGKNLKDLSLVFVEFLDLNNEKLLIIGKINYKKNQFFTYKLDYQHKLNFLKDFLDDFHQNLKNNEECLKENNNNEKSTAKEWWDNRLALFFLLLI